MTRFVTQISLTSAEEEGLARLERLAAAAVPDVHERLHSLRQAERVHHGDIFAELNAPNPKFQGNPCSPIVSIFGYDDCKDVLRDNVTFSSEYNATNMVPNSLLNLDNPQHRELRRVTQKAMFGASLIRQWRETIIQPIVTQYVRELASLGRVDFWRSLLIRFPVTVIYRLMGIPAEQAERMYDAGVHWTGVSRGADDLLLAELSALLKARIAVHDRDESGTDMVSLLVASNAQGQVMSEIDMVNLLHILLPAGTETTGRSAASMLINLLQRPGLMSALEQDRSLIPAAVEESLRFDGPVMAVFRSVKQDYQLGDILIPAGAGIQPVIGAANRDERVFDRPDEFDIHRDNPPLSLAFGFGPHLCIGHQIARAEMEVLLETLLDEMPRLRLLDETTPARMMGVNLRTPNHVKVCWDLRCGPHAGLKQGRSVGEVRDGNAREMSRAERRGSRGGAPR
jgi:cytochrome P450